MRSPDGASTSSTSTARNRPRDALGGLYGIAGADPGPDGRLRDPLDVVTALCGGGASTVQLRLKGVDDRTLLSVAERALRICRDVGVALVINDRADVCALVGADGVHLGWDDLPPEAARDVVGDAWVGVSTHDPAKLARALAAGPDYVGYGPVWESPTKEGLRDARGLQALAAIVAGAGQTPVVAIGGITEPARVARVMRAGAASAAVLSAVSGAADMREATRRLAQAAQTGGSG